MEIGGAVFLINMRSGIVLSVAFGRSLSVCLKGKFTQK